MFLPVHSSLSKEHLKPTSPSGAPTVTRSSAVVAVLVCASAPSPPVCTIDHPVGIGVALLHASAVRRRVVRARKHCTKLVVRVRKDCMRPLVKKTARNFWTVDLYRPTGYLYAAT
jgi:hypothetical protein